nr:VP7 [Rotavirus A]
MLYWFLDLCIAVYVCYHLAKMFDSLGRYLQSLSNLGLSLLLVSAAYITHTANAQNFGQYVPITGSLDLTSPLYNDTGVSLSSTLCLYYPRKAVVALNDTEWTNTLSQLFIVKGWPKGSVYFKEFEDLKKFAINPQFYCDYNVVLAMIEADNPDDEEIPEIADLILNEWMCNPIDITMYYYTQMDENNKWIGMGENCTISVCPLNTATLGIGCTVSDNTTFENVAESQTLAVVNVVDQVQHKIAYDVQKCTLRNCNKLGPRENVAIIQIGGAQFVDMSDNPATDPRVLRMMRINWKKWWEIFYTIVDYVNQIVQVMSKRARSIDSYAFYYRM